MIFNSQKFVNSVYDLKDLPKQRLPEIILCGRSNVGKSSFINSFFGRKELAKVSSTPGKTRSINYYLIDNKFYMVDLPGFGYARVSRDERRKWSLLIGDFIAKSENIKLAIHFIDCRYKPTDLDLALNKLLHDLNVPYILLLSKTDKLVQAKLNQAKKILKETFNDVNIENNVVCYSSVKGRGRKEIRALLEEMFY